MAKINRKTVKLDEKTSNIAGIDQNNNIIRLKPKSHAKINRDFPKIEKAIPKPPKFIKGVALREWNRVAELMYDAGMVTDLDQQILASYCINVEIMEKMINAIDCRGGYAEYIDGQSAQTTPAIKCLQEAMNQISKLSQKLGLNPVDRLKMKAIPKTDKEVDPMEKLFGHG